MTVEQFDPQEPKQNSNSAESQTTTLDISSKMFKEQHQVVVNSNRTAKVGFVSLALTEGTSEFTVNATVIMSLLPS